MVKVYFKEDVFYREDEHGPRLIQIEDPDQVWPINSIPDPAWVPLIDPEDPTAAYPPQPMIDVEDKSAGATMILVPNPDTTIPLDAVELTDAEYIACLDALMAKSTVSTGLDGKPVMVAAPPPDPVAVLLKKRIFNARNLLAFTAWFIDMHDLDGVAIPPIIAGARANATAFLLANGETL